MEQMLKHDIAAIHGHIDVPDVEIATLVDEGAVQ